LRAINGEMTTTVCKVDLQADRTFHASKAGVNGELIMVTVKCQKSKKGKSE